RLSSASSNVLSAHRLATARIQKNSTPCIASIDHARGPLSIFIHSMNVCLKNSRHSGLRCPHFINTIR
ncbi:MAG TPA: hypothetical protein VL728_15635, partial [Cyclobacteriaceae bacterium]|nr:hypothetical protein [Cyclobacteriaceae bacterium]